LVFVEKITARYPITPVSSSPGCGWFRVIAIPAVNALHINFRDSSVQVLRITLLLASADERLRFSVTMAGLSTFFP